MGKRPRLQVRHDVLQTVAKCSKVEVKPFMGYFLSIFVSDAGEFGYGDRVDF